MGGKYNPANDSWTATSTANAPTARISPSAVWTGSEMIVWGWYNYTNGRFDSGGRVRSGTDSWVATSIVNAPEARWSHSAEWTGTEMIVWGGTNQTIYLNTGGRYNPATDSWMITAVPNVVRSCEFTPQCGRATKMIVWGGADSTFNDCNTGGIYNPSTDSWMAASLTNAPSARDSHTAVWTGGEMVIWVASFAARRSILTQAEDTLPIRTVGQQPALPTRRLLEKSHTAVWTGTEMIVWGGRQLHTQPIFQHRRDVLRATRAYTDANSDSNSYANRDTDVYA